MTATLIPTNALNSNMSDNDEYREIHEAWEELKEIFEEAEKYKN